MGYPSDSSTTERATKPFLCMTPPRWGTLAGSYGYCWLPRPAGREPGYHCCMSPSGMYPLETTGRGPFSDQLEGKQLSRFCFCFAMWLRKSQVSGCGVPCTSIGALAVDGNHHSSTHYKPVCKMGFLPAEAQIQKLWMISAKDSQKEGQP